MAAQSPVACCFGRPVGLSSTVGSAQTLGRTADAMSNVTIRSHDDHPVAESAVVDEGIGQANDAAAPLHEVRPLSCFAHAADGKVVGGAVGRRWGQCCELQQLWVAPAHRHQGIATELMASFERQAQAHGCETFYLETFSFQAPEFYRALGYEVAHENNVFPHGIVKYLMVKQLGVSKGAA
jgi:ribosomal protein S18 acetylase RimI-like enzyme